MYILRHLKIDSQFPFISLYSIMNHVVYILIVRNKKFYTTEGKTRLKFIDVRNCMKKIIRATKVYRMFRVKNDLWPHSGMMFQNLQTITTAFVGFA